ncbi:hypothetical protein COCMIDRAFT_103961 [Bipolaris oryzae ATCC 44560]|uniref:TauD/TfdA-like domain-containing protein n=1 Tax=Bipolaris oryzae ATCC 44560 TaxID=930090 RepID=W6Z3S6_COCMI|nr:uncharacterized protein COCMIDRAFT_103961 [Bipolaris oryzae ATCC 44560]EUC42259.1 hypothetical protein COCMIDRAFT_103961 [Bipolaris oryzae ATCC 44560]
MSASATLISTSSTPAEINYKETSKGPAATRLVQPLKSSGALDAHAHFSVTPVIGEEFEDLQVSQILHDDDKIRDLAIMVSERGVVFLRNQDITLEDQKALAQKLGDLTGKPKTSKLHRHAFNASRRGITDDPNDKVDPEVFVICSKEGYKYYDDRFRYKCKAIASEGWHSDMTYEQVPPDYSLLKIHTIPNGNSGGDTLWASGYEAYDRMSPPWKVFAESLTGVHAQPNFSEIAKRFDGNMLEGNRGSPLNTRTDFAASHPVIRTNPVTGWKSLFGAAHQLEGGYFEGMTKEENHILKAYFLKLIAENHDLQVRLKWNVNDLAIWDNRCVFHSATNDVSGNATSTSMKKGNRAVSLGEKPFFDPVSKSRQEALAL